MICVQPHLRVRLFHFLKMEKFAKSIDKRSGKGVYYVYNSANMQSSVSTAFGF